MDRTNHVEALAAEQKPKRPYKTRARMSEVEKLMRDVEVNYKTTRKMLLKSLENCNLGTVSYLHHLTAAENYRTLGGADLLKRSRPKPGLFASSGTFVWVRRVLVKGNSQSLWQKGHCVSM